MNGGHVSIDDGDKVCRVGGYVWDAAPVGVEAICDATCSPLGPSLGPSLCGGEVLRGERLLVIRGGKDAAETAAGGGAGEVGEGRDATEGGFAG